MFFNGLSVFDPRIVGALGRLARLSQGVDTLLGEQRNHLEEHLAGDDGVAQSGMAADDVHAEALGDSFQLVGLLVGVDHRREQQGVQHWLAKRTPVAFSFICRNRMSKAALCPTSTVSSQNPWKNGSTLSMVGWPRSMSSVMPWIWTDSRDQRAPWVY